MKQTYEFCIEIIVNACRRHDQIRKVKMKKSMKKARTKGLQYIKVEIYARDNYFILK